MTDPTVTTPSNAATHGQRFESFDICVTSSSTAVRQALEQILAGLGCLSLDPEESATVELVLAEAMNNIVEHAYPPSDPQGPIHVQCCQKQNGLHFAIRDVGQPMPNGQMPLGLAQKTDVDPVDLAEGGYGWFLIKDLAKDVKYQRIEQENRLDLRIAVAIPRA